MKRVPSVSSADKVKQDIVHILKCVKGSDAFHPDFGVDWLKIKQIRKALAGYNKIKSIDRIEISNPDSNRNVRIKLYLTLDSEKIDVEVVI